MLDRLVNIFFFFTLVFIFLLFAKADDHTRIFIAILLSVVCGFIAFMLNWLTLDGVVAAILFGIISYGLGGLTGAAVVLTFFVSSSLLSKDMISDESLLDKKFRRDGHQVWSNGFWFTLWTIIWFLTKMDFFMTAAIASIAFANADTWASEIGGHRVKGKTYLISNFREVKPGSDGGISIIGTLATLAGAVLIAVIFWLLNMELNIWLAVMIAASGFAGSFIDSWLGAKVQGIKLNPFFRNLFARQISYVDNNLVNWMAAGSSSVIALIAVLLIEF